MDGGMDSGQQAGACQAAGRRRTVNRRIMSFWSLGGRRRTEDLTANQQRQRGKRIRVLLF